MQGCTAAEIQSRAWSPILWRALWRPVQTVQRCRMHALYVSQVSWTRGIPFTVQAYMWSAIVILRAEGTRPKECVVLQCYTLRVSDCECTILGQDWHASLREQSLRS